MRKVILLPLAMIFCARELSRRLTHLEAFSVIPTS